jgi:hypothetical protein
MVNLRWDGDDFRNEKDSSGSTADLISHSGKLQQGYKHGSLTRGLVAYYPFDGDVQDYALDNNGTDNTSAGYTSGKIGSSAKDFDGNDDYIDIGDIGLYEISRQYSVSAWIKSPAGKDEYILSEGSNTEDPDGFWGITSSTTSPYEVVRIYIRNDNNNVLLNVDGTVPVKDGTWNHICWIDNNGDYYLYINGSLDISGTYPYEKIHTENTQIGRWLNEGNHSGYQSGTIDDLRIYDRTLSLPEIKALSNISNPSTVSAEDTLQ